MIDFDFLRPAQSLSEVDSLLTNRINALRNPAFATLQTGDFNDDIGLPDDNEIMYQQMGGHITSPEELEPLFEQASRETGIDIRVLKAIAKQESDFNPRVRSKAGAMGVMQLMPGTAKEVGVTNPYDPAQNIMGGARYFRKMYDMFGGNMERALAAYNAGPGNVRKYGGIPPFKETQNYVRRIMNGAAINNALREMRYTAW